MERELREFATINFGKTIINSNLLKSPNAEADLIPYLRSYVDLGSVKPNPQRWVRNSIAKGLDPGNIVISSTGSPGVVNYLDLSTAISSHLLSVHIHSDELLPEWARNILRVKISDLMSSSKKSGSLRLTSEEIEKLTLPIPSIQVQRGDIRNFSLIEAKVIEKLKIARELRACVASIFLDMFGSNFTYDNSAHHFTSLNQIATIRAGRKFKTQDLSEELNAVTMLTGLHGDSIQPSTQSVKVRSQIGQSEFYLRTGDLLVARYNDGQPVVLFCGKAEEGAIFSENLIRVRVVSRDVDPIYLLGSLLSSDTNSFRIDVPVIKRKRPILVSRLSEWLLRVCSMKSQLLFRESFLTALRKVEEADRDAQEARMDLRDTAQAIIQREQLSAAIRLD